MNTDKTSLENENQSYLLGAVSGMLPDAIEFAIWLRDNFSPMSAQRCGKWLHKRYWRRDFTDEIIDVDTLYKEWYGNYR
jgi:hypothetical protein